MRRPISTVLILFVLGTLVSPLPVLAIDARTSIPGGMCTPWTTRQASRAMKEQMEVVREDPDYCVWYSKKDHSGAISTLSASLWGGDPSSDEPLIDQARGQEWRGWTSEDTVAGVPMLLTDVRRSRKDREITAAAFPDATTWIDINATSVIGADVRRAVKQLVEIAAPTFAAEASASPAATEPAPVETGSAPSDGPATACALLTLDEASDALGAQARLGIDVPEQCLFSTDDSMLEVVILTAGADQTASMLDRRTERSSDATPTEVGGYPALVEVGPLLGVPTIHVYPSEAVELSIDLVTAQEIDAQAVLLALAELAVARLVEAGLPAAPTPVPTVPTSGGLCSILSADEASSALGGAVISQTVADPDGCSHVGEDANVAVYLEILRGDRAAEMHQQIATVPDQFEVAGMPAAQADMPPASILVLLPDDATAVMLTIGPPEGVDATAAARALAELVAPRVRTYLGL